MVLEGRAGLAPQVSPGGSTDQHQYEHAAVSCLDVFEVDVSFCDNVGSLHGGEFCRSHVW